MSKEDKKSRNSLQALRKQVYLWHSQIEAWLNDAKKVIGKDDIATIAVSILQYTYLKGHITKEDLEKVECEEPSLSPSRVCSRCFKPSPVSAGQRQSRKDKQNDVLQTPIKTPTKSASGSPTRRVQSRLQTREARGSPLQPNDAVRVHLNFDYGEDEQLCEGVQNNTDLKEENSRLTQDIEELGTYIKKLKDEKQNLCSEVERIEKEKKTMQDRYEREYLGLEVEFNIYKAEMSDQFVRCGDRCKIHAMRYRAERDELRYELTQLNAELQKIGEKGQNVNRITRDRLVNMTYVNDRQEVADIELQELTTERDILKRTIEDQKTLIQEIQKRKDEMNDAKIKITQYQEEANRYKTACEEANAKVSLTKMEKEEILSMLQKQKNITEAETNNKNKIIENLQNVLKKMEAENCNIKNYVDKLTKTVEQTKLLSNSHTYERLKEEQVVKRYRDEIDQANHEVESLKSKVRELKGRLNEQHTANEKLEKNIKDLKDQLAHVDNQQHGERLSLNYQEEQLGKKNEELLILTKKLQLIDEQLTEAKETNNHMHTANEDLKQKLQEKITLLHESNNRFKEAEERNNQMTMANEDLKQKLQETITLLHESNNRYNVENTRYRDSVTTMEKERNIEITKLQGLVNQLRSELQSIKSHDEQEKNSIKHELSRLKEHNHQLDNDKHILGKEIYSLNDQKLDLEKRLQQAESHVKSQQMLFEENESLKKALTTANMDRKHCEERCKTETEVRLSRDKVSTELRNENDRLRKERNAAMSELQKRTEEKNQLLQKLQTEINAAKQEQEQLQKDKDELLTMFKEKSNRDKETISKLEQQYETLTARCKTETEVKISRDKISTELKNENDRLKKERNAAMSDLQKRTEEKSQLLQKLQTEINAAKQEHEQLKKDKDDLITVFKEKSNRDKEKISKLEQQCETLTGRLRHEKEIPVQNDDTYNSKLMEENNRLRSERNLARIELHTARSECETLKREKDDLIKGFKEKSDTDKEQISTLQEEFQDLRARYEKETETQSGINDTCNKLSIENERLRSERNAVNAKLLEVRKEKEDMSQELKQEVTAAKAEHEKLNKEKDDLIRLLKDESNKSKEKCHKLEREIENLNIRYSSEEKMHQHNAYELLQLRNDIKVCKIEKAQLEEALKDQKEDNIELENKLRDLEFKESKCAKCDQYERTMAKLKKEKQELQDNYNIETTNANNAKKTIQELLDTIEGSHKEKQNLESIVFKSEKDLENQKRSYESLQGEHSSLRRRVENLLPENADLKQKCRIKDDLLQKADKENRQLKIDNDQLKSNIIGHHQEIETLNTRIEILREEKFELETRTRSRSPQVTSEPKQCQKCWKYKNDISELKKEVNSLKDRSRSPQVTSEPKQCQKCWKYKSDISELKKEVNSLKDRLSEAAGNKLRDNNPNIADLGDVNRPTSLAEKFSTLYTDEYTDALEVIANNTSEADCAGTLLQWLKNCFDWCEQLAKEQRDLLTEHSIGFMKDYLGQGENFVISARCLVYVKEFQKKISVDSLTVVGKICHIKSLKEEKLLNDSQITKYIKKCSELCWMMQISDPPLCLDFDVKRGDNLDRNSYNVFTKSGGKIDFLVWPVLYLHKTGPLLAKGVAQGM